MEKCTGSPRDLRCELQFDIQRRLTTYLPEKLGTMGGIDRASSFLFAVRLGSRFFERSFTHCNGLSVYCPVNDHLQFRRIKGVLG